MIPTFHAGEISADQTPSSAGVTSVSRSNSNVDSAT
jgi:hypothetical protein